MLPSLSFAETVQMLAGGVVARKPAATPVIAAPPAPPFTHSNTPGKAWQRRTWAFLTQACANYGAEADAYLCGKRGLANAVEYRIGWTENAMEKYGPALVLPWFTPDGQLTALRYRLMDGETRYMSASGSKIAGWCFGMRLTCKGRSFDGFGADYFLLRRLRKQRRLVLVEGEINALSIAHVLGRTRTDVWSVGSEAAKLGPRMWALARGYGHVLVWTDRVAMQKHLLSQLPEALTLASEEVGGDANDLLRNGDLLSVVASKFLAADPEGMRWSLRDLANYEADHIHA